MHPEILVIGALHLDVIVDAPHFPQPDETVVGNSVSYRLGGKGGNQALAAARMGSSTAMAGRIGTDEFGERIRRSFKDTGVDDRQVRQVAGSTGMSVAIVDPGGDYGAVIVSGVNTGIDPSEITIPRSLKGLLLQCEIPQMVNHAAIARAPRDCCVILNAAPYRDHVLAEPEAIGRVDVLVVNRVEAAQHAGLDQTALDADRAAEKLIECGPANVIVTLGGDGLLARTKDACFELPGINVDVVSTHGAGDAFIGALAAELTKTSNLRSAAEFAQAAAALTISTRPGNRATLDRKLVLDFMNES